MSSSKALEERKSPLDLSLYLVTDSTPAILQGRDLCRIVEAALKGGVTIVQYRDKTSDTNDLINTARELHKITQRFHVPLVINDRIDVALAVGAEGVHLGQDDMKIDIARKILPKNAFIGISASSVEEASEAVRQGADYLGIGTMFATPTKTNTKSIIGPSGTREILATIGDVPAVAIGGINLSNVQKVIQQSRTGHRGLDGVAVVSAIMAAEDPEKTAQKLKELIWKAPSFVNTPVPARPNEIQLLEESIPLIVNKMVKTHPLVHSMINFVVANFAANVALAIGASPIMAPNGDEAEDLAKFKGSLLINIGTLTNESISQYLKAVAAYNESANPVIFDPVGAGATQVRREAVKELMIKGYFDLIKGNEAEIRQVYGAGDANQRGVDSGASSLTEIERATLARALAFREGNIVLLTGAVDYLSDGQRTVAIANGHKVLGQVTGTGCSLGTVLGAFLATHPEDKFLATLAGILMFEIAAENAMLKDSVHGPGTFVPAFIDELDAIRQASLKEEKWHSGRFKITMIEN